YWMFRVIPGLSGALTRTLDSRDADDPGKAGYGAGVATCVMSLIPGVNVLTVVPWLMWLRAADRSVQRLAAWDALGRDPETQPGAAKQHAGRGGLVAALALAVVVAGG